MSMRVRICQVSAAVLLLHAWSARAEEKVTETTSSPLESPRALNSHVFQPTRLLASPFTDTAVGMATFAGAGEIEAPFYGLTGLLTGVPTGTKKYTIASYGTSLNADFRLFPDIGLRFEATALVFTATTARGLLVAGGTVQSGFTIGLTAGKNLNRDMRLSFVADFGIEPQYSVLIANAVRNALPPAQGGSGTFDDTGLLTEVNRYYGSPGLSFAWAPNPAFGLIAEARYVWLRRISNQTDSEARDTMGMSAGGILSFDLEPLIRWPIGFQAGYRADIPFGSNGIFGVTQVSFGVYYTRRVRLALGLEGIWRHGDVRPGVEPTLTADTGTAAIQLRYYW
jgi:hypothetical protein